MMREQHKINQSGIHYYINKNPEAKETILFIHPAFVDHNSFKKQVEFFKTHYTVITLDLIGHGLSHIKGTKDSIYNTNRHIYEILEEENIDKVHISGVSIGSYLGQHFANTYPDRVASLTSLGGCNINNYDNTIEKEQRKQQLSFMIKALVSIKWFSKSNASISAHTCEAKRNFYHMNLTFKRRSLLYLTSLGEIMNQNKETLPIPTLILYGEYDNELAIFLSEKWSDESKKSSLVKIKEAGHCANMDSPELYNDYLFNFLQSL